MDLMLNSNNILYQCLNFEKNMTFGVLENQRTDCHKCGSSLKRINRYRSDNKGKLAFVIDYAKGPQIMIHYLKTCEKCSIKYHYGRIYESDKIFFLSNERYVQISSVTFVSQKVFSRQNYWTFEKGCSPGSIAKDLKIMFETQITKLKDAVAFQQLGRKSSFDLHNIISENELRNGWYLWSILKSIEKVTSQNIVELNLPKTDIEAFENPPKKKRKTENKLNLRTDDLFLLLFKKYKSILLNYDGEWIHYWPSKIVNGKVIGLKGHGVTIGDVDAKVRFDKCSMNEEDYQNYLKFALSESKKLTPALLKYMCCNNPPIRGNQHSDSYLVCMECKELLLEKGLPDNLIDEYIKWRNRRRKTNESEDDGNSDESIITPDILNHSTKVLFDKIQLSFENGSKNIITRKSNRITSKTRANLNESLQYLNDTRALLTLEGILNEPVAVHYADNNYS